MSFFDKFSHHLKEAVPAVNEHSRPQQQQNQSQPQQHPMTNNNTAPRFFNIKNHDTVYERIFLLHGGAGAENTQFDASVVIYHHLNSFPAQRFPVADGFFKALVHLEPGENTLTVSFEPPGQNQPPVNTQLVVNYLPLVQNPPLHLALILGKDSKGEYDCPKWRKDKEGNGVEMATKKLRMAGYMMSAFTNEQMYRSFGTHQTFRLNEEFAPDTLSNRDKSAARSTAKVHVLRADKTVAEIQDPNIAQQNKDGKDKNRLFSIALDTLRAQGKNSPFDNGSPVTVLCIFVDAHWDLNKRIILGHAALGGGHGNIRLAIFGGHAMHAWPSCLEEVVPNFMDDTDTDERQVANDSNQSGTTWENCNVGMGAAMHEAGHAFGMPHRPHGVMLRDYITLNRSFMVREPNKCSRTGKPGMRLTLPKDECGWHRLDCVTFKFHPSFKLPHEPVVHDATKPNLYPVDHGAVAKSSSGIYLIELHVDGQCRAQLEYIDQPQREVFLVEDELQSRLPEQFRGKPIKLDILARGEQKTTINNLSEVMTQGQYRLNNGRVGFKSNKLGGGSGNEQMGEFPNAPVTMVRIHAGRAVDGVEVFFADKTSVFVGKKGGGNPHDLKLEQGEQLLGFYCRTGAWVDGISVVTNQRRTSIFGNPTGGSGHDLVAPPHYRVAGIYGNVGAWVISIGIIYSQ